MPRNFTDAAAKTRVTRNVVMLADHWGGWTTGISSINQSLASELSSFTNVVVYCVILSTDSTPSAESLYDTQNATVTNCETGLSVPVRLIHVNLLASVNTNQKESTNKDRQLYQQNITPADLRYAFQQFSGNISSVLTASGASKMLPQQADFIVGHAPISAAAALLMRKSMYPDSKVILFYHFIPNELDWTARNLPFPIQETEDLVRQAEVADIVYSVTPKVHAFFEARFRSSARVKINHHLFIPLCSKNIFDINESIVKTKSDRSACFCMSAFAAGNGVEDWMGIDIAICAAGKVAEVLAARSKLDEGQSLPAPGVHLTVLNIHPDMSAKVRVALEKQIRNAEKSGARIVLHECPSDPWQAGPYRQLTTGTCYDLCLVPTRSEPCGQVGLEAISGGLPTLLSEQSVLASVIRRLTTDPASYLVKTTRDVSVVRQDAAEWCKRIIEIIDHPQAASEQALLLQGALKREESIRNTHDDFITYCLSGIGVKFNLIQFQLINPPKSDDTEVPLSNIDEPNELSTRRRFNKFLLEVMRQSWRIKRHPLQSADDLPVLLNRLPRLPVCQLVAQVINAIEENDRRIVSIDCENETVVVYCPDIYALRDLWAMCDRINSAVRSVLLPPTEDYTVNPVMIEHGLRRATTKVVISGPEYLNYKDELVALVRRNYDGSH